MISYANTFEVDFSLLLRERRSPNLATMQESSIEVESNMMVANRLKGESDRGSRAKKKQTSDDKIEEMTKVIKGLT